MNESPDAHLGLLRPTPTYVTIGVNGTYDLDFNHGAIIDFALSNRSYHSTTPDGDEMRISPLNTRNRFGRRRRPNRIANSLPLLSAGVRVGLGNKHFRGGQDSMAYSSGPCGGHGTRSGGPWKNVCSTVTICVRSFHWRMSRVPGFTAGAVADDVWVGFDLLGETQEPSTGVGTESAERLFLQSVADYPQHQAFLHSVVRPGLKQLLPELAQVATAQAGKG
jgi:hypothetical protein